MKEETSTGKGNPSPQQLLLRRARVCSWKARDSSQSWDAEEVPCYHLPSILSRYHTKNCGEPGTTTLIAGLDDLTGIFQLWQISDLSWQLCRNRIADITAFLLSLVGCLHPQKVRVYFQTFIYKNIPFLKPPQLYPSTSTGFIADFPWIQKTEAVTVPSRCCS